MLLLRPLYFVVAATMASVGGLDQVLAPAPTPCSIPSPSFTSTPTRTRTSPLSSIPDPRLQTPDLSPQPPDPGS